MFQKLTSILVSPDLRPPAALADALFFINDLATPEGMDALLPELDGPQCGLRMFPVAACLAAGSWSPCFVRKGRCGRGGTGGTSG